MRVHASVPTASGSRYLQQLCKHWSHRFAVDFTPEHGTVTLPNGTLRLTAKADSLDLELEGEDVERMKAPVAEHLGRFAFREAPLRYDWVEA